jgi:hypothetical protein
VSNPYRLAWRRRRQHEREARGWVPVLARWLPALALGAAGPLVRPVFLHFLDLPDRMSDGVEALGLRLGLVLAGALSIATYQALVRGPERAVLDPHPAKAGDLLRYLTLRTASERAPWVMGAAMLCLPVLYEGHLLAWALLVACALAGWLSGLLTGFTVHLGSVWAAESPALAGVLNALRGSNPRLQAALIYAPGVVLMASALGVMAAASGARMILEGEWIGVAGLLVAPVLGFAMWLPAAGLAKRQHFRTTLVLAEIDGAYAMESDPEEARRVRLEWAVRFLPQGLRMEALKELRHGYRSLRGWINTSWGVALVGLLSAWTDDAVALDRTLALCGLGLVVVALVGIRLAATDPVWLDRALPRPATTRGMARLLALLGWMQPGVWTPVIALGIRQGSERALWLLLGLQALALALAVVSTVSSALRNRGLVPYLLGGLLLWAGLVGGAGLQ